MIAASASSGSTTSSAAMTVTVNDTVSSISPSVKVAVKVTSVSSSGLVTTPALLITLGFPEVQDILISPIDSGKIRFPVTESSESPLA